MNNFEHLLKNIGLSEKEFLIYETLYKNGSMSVSDISKELGIPRTTVYQNSDNLLKKGLIAHTVKGTRKQLIAELPTRLETIIQENKLRAENKIKEIAQIENSIPQLLEYFNNIVPKAQGSTKSSFKYYEGKESVERVYDNLLTCPIIKAYVNTHQVSRAFPENTKKFTESMNRGTVVYDMLTDEVNIHSQNELAYCENYHYKFFPKGQKIEYMDYLVYGNSIAIIQWGIKPSAIVIENELLAANAKTIYDVLWNLLPNPNV